MSNAPKSLSDYSYAELKQHLDALKAKEIESVKEKLAAARLSVTTLESELEQLGGAALTPQRRGRKPGSKNLSKVGAAAIKGKRSPRGATKESILSFLSKGAGATIKEIAAATGIKYPSVAQTLMALKKSGEVKQGKGRGAPYSAK